MWVRLWSPTYDWLFESVPQPGLDGLVMQYPRYRRFYSLHKLPLSDRDFSKGISPASANPGISEPSEPVRPRLRPVLTRLNGLSGLPNVSEIRLRRRSGLSSLPNASEFHLRCLSSLGSLPNVSDSAETSEQSEWLT
jgi:hypothetical protein